MDGPDHPEEPISDEVQQIAEWIGQVGAGQQVATCLQIRLQRLERVCDGRVIGDEVAPTRRTTRVVSQTANGA